MSLVDLRADMLVIDPASPRCDRPTYQVPVSELRLEKNRKHWLGHLREKMWWTPAHDRAFINAMSRVADDL